MSDHKLKILYTKTDEAPALATYSWLPIVQTFAKAAGVTIETRDISLASRILSNVSDYLKDGKTYTDHLSELGTLAKTPEANIIKLPNISASIPQLKEAIQELKDHGYKVPDFPEDPETAEEKAIRACYAKVLGSAVNPVLREGNSDRRVAAAVKQYAKDNPHTMGAWSKDSKSHVAHMKEGDFYGSEQSVIMEKPESVTIVHKASDGTKTVLKEGISLEKDEVIDSAVMQKEALRNFFSKEIQDANDQDVLLSLHLKATMMKVSDPIMFGHALEVYFKEVFEKYSSEFEALGVVPNNGLGDLYHKIETLPKEKQQEIKAAIDEVYKKTSGCSNG